MLLFPAAGRGGFVCQFLQRDLTAEQLIDLIIRQGDLCAVRRGIRQGFRNTGCHTVEVEQHAKNSCCQQSTSAPSTINTIFRTLFFFIPKSAARAVFSLL